MKGTAIRLAIVATSGFLIASAGNVPAQEKHAAPPSAGAPAKAVAVLQPTKGSDVKGTVTFTKTGDGLHVSGEITGLAPGKHGFHIHEFGDQTSSDGKAAGGHFNPAKQPHGAPDAGAHHAGDLGNIEADQSGVAKVDVVAKGVTLDGATSVLGRGLVVHAKADDLKSQPAGEAGDRVSVGVIGVAKEEEKK